MSKIKNIKEFFDLERRADLKGLEVGDYSLWSFLRTYYAEEFVLSNNPGNKPSVGLAAQGVKALGYGLRYLFGNYEYLAFTAGNQRKLMDGKWVHPLDLLPPNIRRKTLFIELPILGHKQRTDLPDPRVVSRFWMILREFLWIKTRKTSDYENMAAAAGEIGKSFDVSLNVGYLLKRFYAGHAVMESVLDRYQPKAVFCAVSSTMTNYILACKERNIPVIEIQHGYIGTTHRSYNLVRDLGTKLYPDYFLGWGDYEKQFFSDPTNHFITSDRVFTVGNFYLDGIQERGTETRLRHRELLRQYASTVALSVQDPLEKQMMPFLIDVALALPEVAFLILPRTRNEAYYREHFTLPDNFLFFPELNTYEGILISDLHTTIWSTTAFESLALGRANLLINPDNMAFDVFGHLLNEESCTYYAGSPEEFARKLPLALAVTEGKARAAGTRFFRSKFVENIEDAVKKILTEISVRC